MNILITSLLDMDRSAPSRLHHIVRWLAARHEITVISPEDTWKTRDSDKSAYSANFPDIREYYTRIHIGPPDLIPAVQDSLAPFMADKICRLCREADVHLNYNSLVVGLSCAALSRVHKVNTVLDIADDIPAMVATSPQIPPWLRRGAGRLAEYVSMFNVATAHTVCCASEYLASSASVPTSKTRIIPNGVDTTEFSEKKEFEKGLTTCPKLTYVGVLREWVDLDSVLEALRLLGDARIRPQLVLAGGEGDDADVRALVDRGNGLVSHMGSVPYEQVPDLINNANIGLIPFRQNHVSRGAFPLKALEYAACGRPVVSASIPELRRIFGDAFYFADSPKEIRDAVQCIIDKPADARIRVDLAKEIVSNGYDWKTIVTRYESILMDASK